MSDDDEVEDLLLMQEYISDGKMLHLVWRVPAGDFLDRVRQKVAEGMEVNKAKTKVLVEMYKDDLVEYVGVTDQDAELFAANLREEGVFARYLKGMPGESDDKGR